MKCAACHNQMVARRGEIDLRIKGQLYLVRNVFYEECQTCGERVISPQISQVLFEKIKKGDFVEATMTIPVLDGTYG